MHSFKYLIMSAVLLIALSVTLFARETKFHDIGRLHELMGDSGSEGRATWPAGFGWQANIDQKGHWIAVKNFTDVDGQDHAHYVAEGGTYYADETEYNIPVYIHKYRRTPLPLVTVDGEIISDDYDEADGFFVDPSIPAKEMIESKWHTGAGVTITRRSYAWSEREHQDYIIMDYTLVNTGEMDEVEGVDQSQTLEDMFFVFQTQLHPGERGEDVYTIVNSTERDGWAEFYGSETGDSLNILYGWDGKSSTVGGEMFDPRPADGYILAPQHVGFGVIHVDSSPADQTHWSDMPNSVRWRGYGDTPSHSGGITDQEMYDYISQGNIQRQSQDPDPTRYPVKHAAMSFGPYTLDHQDSIRIVLVEAVGGVSQELCRSVGSQWINNEITTQEMYDIVGTGLDSLHNEVWLAQQTFMNGYVVPESPPSPDLAVNSEAGQVLLEWGDVSNSTDPNTGAADFAGYRVYRQIGTQDSIYSMIFECGEGTENALVHEYADLNVDRGVAYHYYVTAFDTSGLESGTFENRTTVAAHPVRVPEPNAESVRVIPNPYNYNSVNLYQGERDKILFVNLPPIATIRIYTLSGDLVRTIEHTDLSGDEPWDLVTSSNQLVRSGLYVYHIEGTDETGSSVGNSVGKLVIVR